MSFHSAPPYPQILNIDLAIEAHILRQDMQTAVYEWELDKEESIPRFRKVRFCPHDTLRVTKERQIRVEIHPRIVGFSALRDIKHHQSGNTDLPRTALDECNTTKGSYFLLNRTAIANVNRVRDKVAVIYLGRLGR